MYRLKRSLLLALASALVCLVVLRGYEAVRDLLAEDQTQFLAFPLSLIFPGAAFLYLASQRGMSSQEGVLMQLGAMVQILLIIAFPGWALHLALGFPVAFLVVELFETRMPSSIKARVKGKLMA